MNNLNNLLEKKIIIDNIKKLIVENNIEDILNFLEKNYNKIEDDKLLIIYKIMLNYNFNYFLKGY